MSHLSRSEIVDLVEETLPQERAAHLELCAACRDEFETIRAALRDVAAVDVPDPSPLFWEHFQARVRDGVAKTPRPAWDWIRVRGFAPLPAALVAVLVVGFAISSGLMRGRSALVTGPGAPAAGSSTAGPATIDLQDQEISAVLDAGDAEVWAVLTDAAADVGFEDAHAAGMQVYPATIDRAVQNMSPDERNELGRLLQSELKRSMD